MTPTTRGNLMTLEAYSRARQDFSASVMKHEKNRKISLGENVTLVFEDESTIRYQMQEMLRVEKMLDESGIQDELDAYGRLVPDGSNWKATMMIEYAGPVERAARLSALIGIEDRVWVEVNGCAPVYAIADEDLDREIKEKISAVHFLRLEVTPDMIQALRDGKALSMGIAHPVYRATEEVDGAVRAALLEDLTEGAVK